MDWRKRLLGIAVAGGAVTVGAVGCWGGGGACNANPDPCCGLPDGEVCQPKVDCEAKGGTWNFGECIFEAGADADAGDAKSDAESDAASDGGGGDAADDASNDGGDAGDQ